MKLLGIDTGGTFTDLVLYENGNFNVFKVPSTPHNPAEAVLRGIKHLKAEDAIIIHGSTVATNTVLERKGAKVALITNKGIEDVIEIQRQNRRNIYDLCYKKPKPLVPRSLRFGISGRINSFGEEIEKLDTEEIENLAKKLKGKIDVVAISFLFCFLNNSHELTAKKIFEEKGIQSFVSHEILPVFREYERTSCVVLNAYVAPKMEKYLRTLNNSLANTNISIMQSNGGSISVDQAARQPVHTILSGPAGGVVAAKFIGETAGYTNLITLDMGGTSTDVSLIHKGNFQITSEYEIDGLPVGVPVIDIHTIGAGGGSIARLDEGGALKVGPESAGADPGPVCYGKGTQITVCDAHMFLGRLLPELFLSGQMKVYPERIPKYLNPLAKKAKMDPEELAQGIITVANSNMERAIRVVSLERGYDPRDYVLFVFGGTAALHAAMLAKSLNIPKVIIPPNPGVLSAFGMLLSDTVKDYVLTVMQVEPSYEKLLEQFLPLIRKAREEMEKEGFNNTVLFRTLQCRLKGQSYEIEIPFSESYRQNFKETYNRLYHWYPEDKEIEVVNIVVRAVGKRKKPTLPKIQKRKGNLSLEALYRKVPTPVYLREKLLANDTIDGPAIIVEYSSTCYVPEGFEAVVDQWGNLILEQMT
ncbi:N-methylhydantoinase A [Thermosulfidibacter takaii ABI70S6]|uniref:N-methylhydantoinase A n=1 Tax=Thermosulfidibacter takaii (strain DSM 17441 / JCM 13301 / NBRC 103674 / ABI70S6) TaxID=1298851 RepID=A0A0S3QTB6_THET7|nr:hydantoinase/oxoprolinase family protein [Thermosulfidibacter takaii]BAT71575.1 N-methylhydantoinase A [Thermosulfidibacter takaii ABI70S6]